MDWLKLSWLWGDSLGLCIVAREIYPGFSRQCAVPIMPGFWGRAGGLDRRPKMAAFASGSLVVQMDALGLVVPDDWFRGNPQSAGV